MQRLALLAALAASLSLVGCGFTRTASTAPFAGAAIEGKATGGQQPLVGARVYLLAAGTSGYGSASTSLLTLELSGTDSLGGYVLTGTGGNFSITGDYVCVPGQQLYLLALGGDPTGGNGTINNTAVGLMNALGTCPAAATLALKLPHVALNEVTTVAAAYSLGGFFTDATHLSSSGSSQALTGVSNAFATSANLVDPVGGYARLTTVAGAGTVPRSELNALGNVLAACVNMISSTSTPCTRLFGYALSGGSTGTAPTDTASAMINIAHHPGVNVAGLYSLITGAPPFQPTLPAVPNDFSVGIAWPFNSAQIAFDASGNLWMNGGELLEYSNSGTLLSPATGYMGGGLSSTVRVNDLALDPAGNVWVLSIPGSNATANNSYLSEFSNSGLPLSPSGGYSGGGLNQPNHVAIDGTGSVWAANGVGSSLAKFSNSGQPVPGSPFATAGQPLIDNLAIDNANNIWIAAQTGGTNQSQQFTLTELNVMGSLLRSVAVPARSSYFDLSIDAANDVWGMSFNPSSTTNEEYVFELNPSGVAINGSPFAGNTALSRCLATEIDGLGNLWCASDDDSIAAISSTGVPISPDAGYITANAFGPQWIAIDNSGNVWTGGGYNFTNSNIFSSVTVELVGAAAPVVTPLSLSIQQGKLGTRP